MDKQTQASIDALKRIRGKMQAKRASGHATDGARTSTNSGPDQLSVGAWPEPKPLPNGLAPVEPFSSEFMPGALAPWIDDIANRLQCPPDYVAVSAVTALGAVIGRRIGIKPQAKTDWIEIPNLWGAFIGRPGMLKSPAMGEALKPIHRLEAEAAKQNEVDQQAYRGPPPAPHDRDILAGKQVHRVREVCPSDWRSAVRRWLRRWNHLSGTEPAWAHEIRRHEWSTLADTEHIRAGLDLLVDLDYVAPSAAAIGERGGRPKITYIINPWGLQ